MGDDFFNIEKSEPVKMDSKEFFKKANIIFEKIATTYSQSWQRRALKDEEFPDESICDKCTGCGIFKIGDEEKDCVQSIEQGWCYYRFCDYELFGMEIEPIIEEMYELLSVEDVTNN